MSQNQGSSTFTFSVSFLLHVENPPPVATRDGAAEKGAEDERSGERDPDEHADQGILAVGSDLREGDLGQTVESGTTDSLQGPEYDAVVTLD